MQKEFNNQNSQIAITSDSLSREDFNIINSIIFPTERCCYSIERLPFNILTILSDDSLILIFFKELECQRIKTLESLQTDKKPLSLVLQKKFPFLDVFLKVYRNF